MEKEVKIDGVTYVPKGKPAEKLDGHEYKIVRTTSAGVFAGYVSARNGKEVTIRQARRLWYWEGAASLSQLAMEGVSVPEKCKFPVGVGKIVVTNAIEILDCTEAARLSIAGVKIWEA